VVPQDDQPAEEKLESRPPTTADLLTLCRELNAQGARYVVIGGMAVIAQGFTRATEDIDLLVEKSTANARRVLSALSRLPDGAAAELTPEDLQNFEVIRIADEFVVDLMTKACGLEFPQDGNLIETRVIDGVSVPLASVPLLLRLKQGLREKDRMDRLFLENKLKGRR
jgi:hypothetical protein